MISLVPDWSNCSKFPPFPRRRNINIAKEMGVAYINLWSKMQETEFLWDGLHLTPDGNAVVFHEVIKVFNERGRTFCR